MDDFANIAANGIGGRRNLLDIPTPRKQENAECILQRKTGNSLKTEKKMDTKEELEQELAKMRVKYRDFLKDYSPKIEEYNSIIYIKDFMLNGEKNISIPYYGAPLGYARQVYESSFSIDEINIQNAYYICFKGADYKAVVYINNICVGIHEGFFSPFEFKIDENIKRGKNFLKIELYNDYIYLGNAFATQEKIEGDKMYAATGLGYNDPQSGWHHCPPGMGIYNDVYVEIRNRISISDVFVLENEVWVEVENADYYAKDIEFNISVYGQNFKEVVTENYRYIPQTTKTVGMGDSLTEASIKDSLGKGIPEPLKNGKNIYKIPFKTDNLRKWDLETPYLYRVQVEVIYNDTICDKKSVQFGVRSFIQDTDSSPKGMFYLNGRKIRLRGANTMGFEQQDVMRCDIEQLIDDILLAKICNMNFLRLTQRPVQDEVYEYCDKLGLMTQTDLPLFGCMRRTKFAEGIRQAEEMERIVRNHPCNILVSYINEPFPNANNEPHRHLERRELESFFDCCDAIIYLNNPTRVIKHVDGDYDPPCKTMPDNHCYPMWYNGHGIDIGLLNKGYWLPVKPNWYYGCGEYGAEGLDFVEVMESDYPKTWLKEPFHPQNIINAQTGNFHYFFYDTQVTAEQWVEASQEHQAYATQFMTEAFRRDTRMVSNAIHLFIDAWPSGWMKAIMDCKRNPKPAYFAYRNALEPVLISFRTDRYTYYEGEKISIEAYVCNDICKKKSYSLTYELYDENDILIRADSCAITVNECDVSRAPNAVFIIEDVIDRQIFTLKAILLENNAVVTYNTIKIEVFKDCKVEKNDKVVLIENLKPGEYNIAGEKIVVKSCGMLPVHFVSRNTNHLIAKKFKKNDFKNWYDKNTDMITPLLTTTFEAENFKPILTSGNLINGEWKTTNAVAEKYYQGKKYVVCQVDLRQENPVAKRFAKYIYEL